ncbi:Phosphoethanolamine N-methyltransferase [Amphibalanus amphitrite]|uniref:phosphoethanolamine N-methyltransferase n=1 Tax=Amphibalanus amphitrite TaxID=1232801 RepID=A0A6A4WVG4_AMPAM|nr:Phosphoethanolamine N-methyltransferase [Amphibalanus amphitrite]
MSYLIIPSGDEACSVRQQMTDYWAQFSEPTLENMMLNEDARQLAEQEETEILDSVPQVGGMRVLELGAGIGRFTRKLAERAKHVTAVDFLETYIEKNRQSNEHLGNVEFVCMDVTQLKQDNGQYDMIFSNWLLMYLGDDEIDKLVSSMLRWLKPNGYLFIRESCIKQSGNKKRQTNPTFYRSPAHYCSLLQGPSMKSAEADYRFTLRYAASVDVFIKYSGNPYQLLYLLRKTPTSDYFSSFQNFLDKHQYCLNGIKRYEAVYGDSFVSCGGKPVTERLCDRLDLQAHSRVLDVGTGPGGSAIHMASRYGCHVTGIDLSANMVTVALQRQASLPPAVRERLRFEISDITEREYRDASYDVIYSRETLLHVEDKAAVLAKFWRWLKPGGKLLITDYCQGEGQLRNEFLEYKSARAYRLLTLQEYGGVVEAAGFTDVQVHDQKDDFLNVLHQELNTFRARRQQFIEEFSESEFRDTVVGWEQKIARATDGSQVWGLIAAQKPSEE